MEEGKMFDVFIDLPDGYQVQLMVLRESPEKRPTRLSYRSRVWIGHEAEPDPMLYKSQQHTELRRSIDACYSLLLQNAREVITSPGALEAVQQQVHDYFAGPISLVR